MKYFLKSLIVLMCLNVAQCLSQNEDLESKLDCLSDVENEYLGQLYSIFEKKLIEKYGERELHELIYDYVNNFSERKVNSSFFKSFRIDTAAEEFHRLFIKNSELPEEDGLDIELIQMDYEDIDKTNTSNQDYYRINSNSTYISCILQQKTENEEIDALLFDTFTIGNISPTIIAGAISMFFTQNECKKPFLQIGIMLELFVLPSLYWQSR